MSCTWTSTLSCLWKWRRKGSGSTKVTVRMGLHVFLGTVWMGPWYCAEGSSWAPVHVGNHSARIHATFVIQYVGTLFKVGNTHSFRYFGISLLNEDSVTCYPDRGRIWWSGKRINQRSKVLFAHGCDLWATGKLTRTLSGGLNPESSVPV